MGDERQLQGVKIGIADNKNAFPLLDAREPCSITSRAANRQPVGALVVGRSGKRDRELWFFEAMLRQRCANPTHGMQTGQRAKQFLQIRLIDFAGPFHPDPFIV